MNCGTERGWRTHKANNERPCKWCLAWKEKADTPAPLVIVAPVKRTRTATSGKAAKEPKPCGTNAAYQRHMRNKEKACDPCTKAAAAYRKELDDKARAAKGLPLAEGRAAWLAAHPSLCGTAAGRGRHKRDKEPVCEPCRVAYNADKRARYAERAVKA